MAKTATVLLLAGLCALVAAVPAPVPAPNEDRYTDKYDYIDVAAILENSRIRNQYYNCYLGSEPCITPDAKFFKEKFPEAIVTKCRKCTDKQKESFEKIVVYYTEKEPEKWNAILVKAIKDSQKLSSKKSA